MQKRNSLTPERTIVSIDGENFVHRLLEYQDVYPKLTRSRIAAFNFRSFVTYLIGTSQDVEVRYYTTRVRLDRADEATRLRLQSIATFNSQLIPRLLDQNISVIRAGMLRPRELGPCAQCGQSRRTFVEKGVDVRLALDAVTDAIRPDTRRAIIVSSDLDLLPAIRVVQSMGKIVTYITTERARNRVLATLCDETITFNEAMIHESFR